MLPTSVASDVADGNAVTKQLQGASTSDVLADDGSDCETDAGGDPGANGATQSAPGCEDAPIVTLRNGEDSQDHPGGFSWRDQASRWLSWGENKLEDLVQGIYPSLDENKHQNDTVEFPSQLGGQSNSKNHTPSSNSVDNSAHQPSQGPSVSQDWEAISGISHAREEPTQETNGYFFRTERSPGIRPVESQGFYQNYMGSGEMRFCFKDKFQFIDGYWSGNRLISMNLCRLTFVKDRHSVVIVKQANYFYIHINEGGFSARAVAKCNEFEKLNFTLPAVRLKSDFFKLFCIVEILQNELLFKRDALFENFVKTVEETVRPSRDPVVYARSLIFLNKLSKQASSEEILISIQSCSSVQTNLRKTARELLACSDCLQSYSLIFKFAPSIERQPLNLKKILRDMFYSSVTKHRAFLMEKFPASLHLTQTALSALPPEKVVYVTESDLEVFDHLCSLTSDETFLPFFEKEFRTFMNKLQSIPSNSDPCDIIPLVSPVYGFLFKSFHETATEICSLAENSALKDMLRLENGKWKLQKEIQWPGQRSEFIRPGRRDQSLFFKSLESQYSFIYELLKFFSSCQFRKKKFPYQLKVLGHTSNKRDESWKSKLAKYTVKLPNTIKEAVSSTFGMPESMMDLRDERLVWVYVVDATISDVFSGKLEECLGLYNSLLQGFVSFVSQLQTDSYESFRVVGQSALKFMTQTFPYFRAESMSTTDVTILKRQISFITKAATLMTSNPSEFPSFRDLIDEFNRYWALRQLLVFEELECPQILFSQIMNIFNQFMNIVMVSLSKDVPVSAIVGYFQFLNDFMEDFKDLDFLENWYVKIIKSGDEGTTIDTSVLEKVANKLESRSQSCSYRVIDLHKFVKMYDGDSTPPHYLICVVHSLLNLVDVCLSNQPLTRSSTAASDQLARAGLILEAIRRSFLYLKEQPDYVDFNSFFKESTQPFEQIINNCTTLAEFKKRVKILKESFWYIRKMDEIDIDRAIELLVEKNSRLAPSIEELKKCYDLYLTKYNQFVTEASSSCERQEECKSFFINLLCNESLNKEIHFKKWDKDFKTEKIPVILAILSSAWSLKMSEDVSVAGKFLKPHCIQILCVLMLLSVDHGYKGVQNQLAQVLTGQGKSVILGLLSATLALTGHRVRVLCYSKHLSNRDKNDFVEFFHAFKVGNEIEYGTFEDMASELLKFEKDGVQKRLADLVEERARNHKSWPTLHPLSSITDKTVLLIDEVDVFFTKDFYGSTWRQCRKMSLPGLAEIQEKIWNTVKSKSKADQNPGELLSFFQNLIKTEADSGNASFKELERFRHTPGSFPLLIKDPLGNVVVKQYTNLSLMDEHLSEMINNAVVVANGIETDWFIKTFYLNEQGLVSCKKTVGTRVLLPNTVWSYYNLFSYFRLKKASFDHKRYKNYGYLLLSTGSISFARLPDKFPLILGVSGTLTDLYTYEKDIIQSRYRILTHSALPSFFGESNLVFNPLSDFTLVESELDWCSKIFTNLSAMIDAHRAVLIFFYSESALNRFKEESANKFKRLNTYYRLNELTENTESPDLDLGSCEEGDTTKGAKFSVTLATRIMGRGVDYKSSVAVEKNGGVHVIQTFLSIDVKEETQIKGRTARMDNKGSYELILCREHLKRGRILDQDDSAQHTYDTLNSRRNETMDQQGRDLEKRIERAENNHKMTMEYFGL